MLQPQNITPPSEWRTGVQVWDTFTELHPELGLNKGKWAFHNFLRPYRQALVQADAIRMVRNRFWLAHQDRFYETAFDCATGRLHEAGATQPLALAHVLKNPALAPQPQKARPLMYQGLTLPEYFKLHHQLPPDSVEQLLEQNRLLLAANDAVIEAWPSWVWNSETMNAADLQRMEQARLALVEVNHGQL